MRAFQRGLEFVNELGYNAKVDSYYRINPPYMKGPSHAVAWRCRSSPRQAITPVKEVT
jgi:hypothetical protein